MFGDSLVSAFACRGFLVFVHSLLQALSWPGGWHLAGMPPRKRQKTGRQGADALSSGASAPVVATAFDDIPKIMRQALTILDDVHELRHYSSETVHLEPKSLLKPVDGAFPWPICSGGTFKDIAQRAWADPERLIEMSACFCHKAGLVESADKEEFVQQFCKLDVSW